MRVFPIVKKVVTGGGGAPSVDGVAHLGVFGQAIARIAGQTQAMLLGGQAHAERLQNAALSVNAGSINAAQSATTVIGAEHEDTGTQNTVMAVTARQFSGPAGVSSSALAANSTVVAYDQASTATATSLGGTNNTADWGDKDRALSMTDSMAAAIVAESTATAPAGFNDKLVLSGFSIPAIPEGWAVTKVEAEIRFSYDLQWVRVLGSSSGELWVIDSADALVAGLFAFPTTNATRTMATTTWDITSSLANLTPAYLNGLKIHILVRAVVDAGLNNNANVFVDWGVLRFTLSRSGIV